MYLSFLFGVAVIVASGVSGDNNTDTLYFGVFISQESDFDFSGFIPPLELGVDTINNGTVLEGLNGRDYFIKYLPITNAKVSS